MTDWFAIAGWIVGGILFALIVFTHPLLVPALRALNNSALWFIARPFIKLISLVMQYDGPKPQNWKTIPDPRAQQIVGNRSPYDDAAFPDHLRYITLEDGHRVDIMRLIQTIPYGLTHHMHDKLHVDLMRCPKRRPEKMIEIGGKIRDLDIVVDQMSEDQKMQAHSFLHLWTRESQVWLKE